MHPSSLTLSFRPRQQAKDPPTWELCVETPFCCDAFLANDYSSPDPFVPLLLYFTVFFDQRLLKGYTPPGG